MNFTAQGLYNLYRKSSATQEVAVDLWEELEQVDREIWADLARELRDAFRGAAKR